MLPTFANPAVLYLLPLLIVVLVFIRLFQARRREVLSGSLMLWRRLAAQQPKVPPKRLILDRSLLLQCAVLACLILALAAPSLALGNSGRSSFVLMIDNGPHARAQIGSASGLALIVLRARTVLESAGSETDVILCRSAPIPALVSGQSLTPAQAAAELSKIEACISGPGADAIWLFATDVARARRAGVSGGDAALPLQVLSLQSGPDGTSARWQCVTPEKTVIQNAGIVAFGSAQNSGSADLLARVRSFGTAELRGVLMLSRAESNTELARREIAISPGNDETIIFPAMDPKSGLLRLEWKSFAGADALRDDDLVLAAPQRAESMSVRFHSPLPALESLYRSIPAEILSRDDTRPADLEIYVQRLPEKIPDGAKAIMLIAPPSGFRSIFDVGGNAIERPQPQRDEDDELNRLIGDKPESSFNISKSIEVLRTGDFRSLIKDQKTGRTLVARFQDEGRIGYLLAFVPGAGLADGHKLEPALAALLIRIARQAGGLGDPYSAELLSKWEANTGRALPHDWPALPDVVSHGGGVLDETASALKLGAPTAGVDAEASVLGATERRVDAAPWLALLAVALIVAELWLQGSTRAPQALTAQQAARK